MIQDHFSANVIRLARVTAVHPEAQKIEVIFLDNGDFGRDVQVMSPMAGSNFGYTGIMSPGVEGHEPNMNEEPGTEPWITAVVACLQGLHVCLGYLYPQVTQMAFTKKNHKNRVINRHPSDWYTTIDKDANVSARHPVGETFFAIGEKYSADNLYLKDFDQIFNAKKNGDKNPVLRVSVSYGTGSMIHDVGSNWSNPLPPRGDMTTEYAVFKDFLWETDYDLRISVRKLWPEDGAFTSEPDNSTVSHSPGGGMKLSNTEWKIGHSDDIKLSSWRGDLLAHAGRDVLTEAEADWQVLAHENGRIGVEKDFLHRVGENAKSIVGGDYELDVHEDIKLRSLGSFSSSNKRFGVFGSESIGMGTMDSFRVEAAIGIYMQASYDVDDNDSVADATTVSITDSVSIKTGASISFTANAPSEGDGENSVVPALEGDGEDEEEKIATTFVLGDSVALASAGDVMVASPGAISFAAMVPKASEEEGETGGDGAVPTAITMSGGAITVSSPAEVVMDGPIMRVKGNLVVEGSLILLGGGMSNDTGALNISAGTITLTAPHGITENTPTVLTTGIHVDANGQHSA